MNQIEALYRQYASAVFRFAWGLCGDRSLAEDIVSETYFRLLTRAPEVGTQTALAYLLAIARNTYVSGVRRRRREAPLPDALPGPDVDHAARLDSRARLQAVFDAVRSLPEGERTALLLRVDHQLSYEDIAAALRTSVGAAKVRVHRARVRITEAVRDGGRLS
jgi:RNA polymerase sigma-70 factor (ECF subfamily)